MKIQNRRSLILLSALSTLALSLSACKVPAGQLPSGHDQDDDGGCMAGSGVVSASPTPSPSSDPSQSCYADRFQQPDNAATSSVDVLFVLDTSGSMEDDYLKVAHGIDAFVASLPQHSDYQFGVMLAHGSRSAFSGRIYHHASRGPVMSSKNESLDEIRDDLSYLMTHTLSDYAGDGGEEGLYSFTQAMNHGNLTSIRAQGFFRPNAALAVIFISDENDICAAYPAGAKKVPDPEGLEELAKARDCKGITPQSVLSEIQALQGDRPYVVGAITHNDPAYVNSCMARHDDRDHDWWDDDDYCTSQDEYGYGYMDLVNLAGGISVDIAHPDQYASGLEKIGQLVAKKMQLNQDFTLTHSPVDPATIVTRVDGTVEDSTYLSQTNQIHLDDAGTAGSIIDVSYCAPMPAPTGVSGASGVSGVSGVSGDSGVSGVSGVSGTTAPTGTPSPTPTPTPTPTDTVTPSPTPSDTVTPSPTPTDTVTPTPTDTVTPSPTPSPSDTVTPSPTPTCTGLGCGGGVIGV